MVRFANINDLPRVNEMMQNINDIHEKARPDFFKAGLGDALMGYLNEILEKSNKDLVVYEKESDLCGFASVTYYNIPETPYSCSRIYCEIDELGVDKNYQRQGVAKELLEFIKKEAKQRGINRIELNVWEFNKDAIDFYETMGFSTYRRYMELKF